jgi:D-alanyl-D-alanine carboxypeptidase/D-alanyl-D-alanine-endopeptidase (penicillin-binding protein 4)
VFDEQFVHPNWLAKYANSRYSAQVAGLNLNANCVDFWLRATSPGQLVSYTSEPATNYVTLRNEAVTGRNNAVGIYRPQNRNDLLLRGEIDATLGEPVSVPIHDPALFAGTVFAETLAACGVANEGSIQRDRTARQRFASDPSAFAVVAALDTQLPTVLGRANKDSMNLYAECMCKRLAFAISGEAGSWPNGTAAMGRFLQQIGVPATQYKLDDGCGLSRHNAISPDALVKILSFNFHSKNRETFMDSLAVAGADGTFEKRFKGNLKGRVLGKSGYVDGVSAISGYLKAQDDRWYAFSIMMNNCPPGTNNRAKEIQEKIVAAIDANAMP